MNIEPRPTDDSMKLGVRILFTPEMVERTTIRMVEQQLLMAEAFPRPTLTRRQRIRHRIGARIDIARESLALRLAPWLERP